MNVSHKSRTALLGAGLLATVALATAVMDTTQFARGWLCAFVVISMVPIGSLALLLVHGVTGGRWGEDIGPTLLSAARTMPLLLVAVLPVLILRSNIYNWPDQGVPKDVLRLYLNPVFFDIRTLVAIATWSLFVWRQIWRNPVLSALGLVAHLLLISLIPADWVLTIQPGSTSSGFGLGFGIEQIFAALAFTAIVAPQAREPSANRDLSGLLISALLGTVYFAFMQFIVIWYGNIPEKVKWYVARMGGPWPYLVLAGFMAAGALPFLALLNPIVRSRQDLLRALGFSILAGISFHVAWLTVPAFGLPVLGISLVAGAAMMALVVAFRRSPFVNWGAAGGWRMR